MSTRCAIILKVNDNDINKRRKFSIKKLKKSFPDIEIMNWDNYGEQTCNDKCKEVKLNKSYIGIYCHSDGYIDGVGEVLKKNFKNYDDILNLIVGGDCSCVWFDCIRRYANRSTEEWKWLMPKKSNKVEDIEKSIDHEYSYLFENGKWKVKHWCETNYHKY